MRASALKYAILSTAATLAMAIIVLVPFHATLTIWFASWAGHYTAFRLWKEVLLFVCGLAVAYLLLFDTKIRSHTLSRRLIWVMLLYALINAVWGLVALQRHGVSPKAFGYALIVNLRFLAFFLVTWALALRTGRLRNRWEQLILWPAAVVVVFGVLQALVLPHDFLRHFGYGPATIDPFETINHNQHYIRIISTLRGANPLGAYLVIPISVLSVLLVQGKRTWPYILLFIGSLATLYFSFSRSGWVGAAVAIATVLVLQLRSRRAKQYAAAGGVLAVLVLVGLAVSLRNNVHVQNVLYHTQTHSAVKTTSDEGHVSALRTSVHDVIHEPLGRGPGTAGPASVYNNHPGRIAENYYLQIAQETGWLGLICFLLINFGVGYLLWLRRSDPLSLSLLAALIGISCVNLLAHAWTDDTLAYVWWGMAGVAVALQIKKKSSK